MSVRNWSTPQRLKATFGPLCLVGLISIPLLKFSPVPYCPIGLLLGAWCLWAGFVYRSWSRWGINFAVIVWTLAVAELVVTPHRPVAATIKSLDAPGAPYTVADKVLGVLPRPNSRVRHVVSAGQRTIFDTIYTIDENSLRKTPEPGTAADHTVVFMGCSYTYGEGVGDDECLPAQVAQRRPDLHVLNFGFSGYGPHHMLANLESGRVEQVCAQPPRIVIYQMIPDHVRRVVGWVPYQFGAPRYGWEEGRIRRLGRHDDRPGLLAMKKLLGKSRIFDRLIRPHLSGSRDVDLTVGVVQQAAAEVKRRFPGASFHVVLWTHGDSALVTLLQSALEKSGLPLHLVEDLAPELKKQDSIYQFPVDLHPKAAAYSVLADRLCERLFSEP